MLLSDDGRVYSFLRRLDDVEGLVLGNFSGDRVTPGVPDADAWAGSELIVEGCGPGQGLTLEPWEGRVYARVRD